MESEAGDCPLSSNGPIGDWVVSQVTDMSNLFAERSEFNADISKWDVSSATNMQNMFHKATSFNRDISKWDVKSVTNMNNMFSGATSFNQDISKWDVSKVVNMMGMFLDAKQFSQKLCGAAWTSSNAKQNEMFTRSSGKMCCRAGEWTEEVGLGETKCTACGKGRFRSKAATDIKAEKETDVCINHAACDAPGQMGVKTAGTPTKDAVCN